MTKLTQIVMQTETAAAASALEALLDGELVERVDHTTVKVSVAGGHATPRELVHAIEQAGHEISHWWSSRSYPRTIVDIIEGIS